MIGGLRDQQHFAEYALEREKYVRRHTKKKFKFIDNQQVKASETEERKKWVKTEYFHSMLRE